MMQKYDITSKSPAFTSSCTQVLSAKGTSKSTLCEEWPLKANPK